MQPTERREGPANEHEDILEDLLDRWEHSRESGAELSPETLCANCPELQTELESRIDALRKIDGFIEQEAAGEATRIAAPEPAPLPARIGQFEILDLIAEGGMGAVYRAKQTMPERVVALKVIRSGDSSTAQEMQRFQSEAAAAAKLSHPNIVPVFEFGEHEGRHYFTMEYVAGRSLAQTVREDGPFDPQLAAKTIRAVAEAVHYAHEMGVVHRDIKPANVLIDEQGRPRVTDFGIAKQLEVDTALTATGQILGTPDFMAPEQAKGNPGDIGPKSDVFSLGATLYAILTGQSPFRGEDVYSTIRKVIEDDPVSPRSLNTRVDRDLATICLKCLQKAPDQRYATARELADDLGRYLAGETIKARRTPLAVRAVRWVKRHPAIALTALAVAAGLFWGGVQIAQYINYERMTVRYFQNVELRWQVKHGIGEITEDEARNRILSYRVTRRGRLGPVIRVEAVNWLLEPGRFTGARTPDGTAKGNVSVFEYEYHADGRVDKEHAADHTGKRMWSFIFTAKDRGHYLDEHGLPRTAQGTDLVGVKFEFDENGFVLKETYTDFRGNPRPNQDGAFGRQHTRSSDGRIVETTALGPNGEPMQLKTGYATVRVTYDANHNLNNQEYFDLQGKPILSNEGFAALKMEYDEYGRLVSSKAFGLAGEAVVATNGHHEQRWSYEDFPSKEMSLFGPNGQPVVGRDGHHRMLVRFDDRGNFAEVRYYDRQGNPAVQKNGATGARWEFNDAGRSIEMVNLDGNGNPTLTTEGFASWRRKRDENGNPIETAYLDEQGGPAVLKPGHSIERSKWNARNEVIEYAYFDAADKPTMTTHGFARRELKRDQKGNIIAEEYFDAEGKRVYQKEGYTHLKQEFDEYGRLKKTVWYDHTDKPVRTSYGHAGLAYKYDERGNIIETRWLNTRGELTLNQKGYAVQKTTYDRYGRPIENLQLGLDGNPASGDDGVARIRITYDDERHIEERSVYDENDNPVAAPKSGSARVRITRDARGNRLKEEYFDGKGNRVRGKRGYARVETRVDNRGNEIELKYYDEQGRLMRSSLGEFGQKLEFDNRGNIVRYTFLGKDGQPSPTPHGFQTWTMKYDSRGNKLQLCFHDADGRPVAYRGTACTRFVYDRWGREIERTTLGPDLKPAENRDGIAISRKAFDALGRVAEITYFNAKGDPARSFGGNHGVRYKYDVRGNQAQATFFGLDGKPFNLYRTWATWKRKYDPYGRSVELAFFDANGAKALHYYHKFHCAKRRFDRRGREIDDMKYGLDGKPTNGSSGWARNTRAYDANGWLVRHRYFSADGKEVHPVVFVHSTADPAVAGRVGLQRFDVLLEYDGKPVTDKLTLLDLRKRQAQDDKPRKLVIRRGTNRRRIELQIRPSQKLPHLNVWAKSHMSPQLKKLLGINDLPKPPKPARALLPKG